MNPIVTTPAPKFKAQAAIGSDIKEIALSDYSGKWVLLFFYPLDFTFVCPTEIVAFSDGSPSSKRWAFRCWAARSIRSTATWRGQDPAQKGRPGRHPLSPDR